MLQHTIAYFSFPYHAILNHAVRNYTALYHTIYYTIDYTILYSTKTALYRMLYTIRELYTPKP